TPATPGSLVAWSREQLAEIERQLLPLVGPMARILVRDAAANTASRQELYQLLASHLETEDERRRFLTAGGEKLTTATPGGRPARSVSGGLRSTSPPKALTPEATQYACQVLARYIGPIATVVTRKAAQNATDEAQFYAAIAEKVAEGAERERFLRELT